MTPDRHRPDGGETAAPLDVERAGGDPPEPPGVDGIERELPALLGDVDSVTTVCLVRAGLADGSGRSVGERLIGALEDKVTVVGSTLDAGFDPANPELDVLIETDHDHGAIASSLASVGPVDGVVVADVTAQAERELEDDADEADGADANDVFNELKEEVGQEGYGTVVDELEDVSFPGGPDPDEEVDLEAEVGVDLDDGDPEPLDLDGDGTIDLDDDGTIDLDDGTAGDDEDEITARELLGKDQRDGDSEVKAPDERAIEEAIEDVELDAGTGDVSAAGSPAGGSSAQPVGGGSPDENADDDAADPVRDGSSTAPTGGGGVDGGSAETDDQPPVASPSTSGASGAEADPDDGGTPEPAGDAPESQVPRTAGDVDAFVVQLIEALESGAVDEQRRTELREALGIESTHSLDVRLEYLQKRVDNLAAYTDAWEAFLSDQGSGREFMESVRDDLATIEDRLDGVEDGAGGDVEDVTARLDTVERRLSDVANRHDDDVARLDTRMDNVESKLAKRVDAIEDALGALREKVSTLLQWREHIDGVLGDD